MSLHGKNSLSRSQSKNKMQKLALSFLFSPERLEHSDLTDTEYLNVSFTSFKLEDCFGAGDQFGELALIDSAPRQHTALCL